MNNLITCVGTIVLGLVIIVGGFFLLIMGDILGEYLLQYVFKYPSPKWVKYEYFGKLNNISWLGIPVILILCLCAFTYRLFYKPNNN